MVTPEEILRKAELLYPDVLRAAVRGEGSVFPRAIPCCKVPEAGTGLAPAIAAVRRLREASKERIGYGFTVEWREVNSRRLGRNRFPERIVFETEVDFLRYVRKERELAAVREAAETIRGRFPELGSWLSANARSLPDLVPHVNGLLEVVEYLRQHPRPNLFARELPLSVDSKFVERHAAVLTRWLDLVLPPHAIRSDEEHFERRYGLRYAEPHLFLRFLDDDTRVAFGFPCETVTVPLHTAQGWPSRDVGVLVVENKVNLLTLPRVPRSIAVGGMGNAVTLLRYCAWLERASITYWGDIDVQGYEILSRLRGTFPQTTSVMMDPSCLDAFSHLRGRGTGAAPPIPPCLTDVEREAFETCVLENVRLEQERIPQCYVLRQIALSPASSRLSGLAGARSDRAW